MYICSGCKIPLLWFIIAITIFILFFLFFFNQDFTAQIIFEDMSL